MTDIPWKTTPFDHQRNDVEKFGQAGAWARFWEPGCVDADTEYLSPDGWRRIADYDGGPVAQFDPDSETASFVEPQRYVVEDCPEFIQLLSDRGLNQRLSPDHRVLHMTKHGGAYKWTTAEELERETTGAALRRLPVRYTLATGDSTDLSDPELRVQVAVMADGHFPKHSQGTHRTVLRLKKAHKKDRLVQLLSDAGIEYRRRDEDSGFSVFSFPAPLRTKRLGDIAYRLSPEQADAVLDELPHWDGSFLKGGGWAYFSAVDEDLDAAQFLACSRGLRAYAAHDPQGTRGRVIVRGGSGDLWVRERNISRVPSVDGKAYCFQVPTGALVLRREGNVFITGNCGKTQPTLTEAAWLYQLGEIDGVIVLAPNGVHRNWAVDQVPTHLGVENYKVHTWQTQKAATRWHMQAFKECLEHEGLALLFMSYDSIKTDKGSAAWRSFLKQRRCLYVLDESPRIKTPTSQVTKRVLGSRGAAPYRRILTGTPVDDKPFDVYSQVKFLNPEAWNQIGCRNYTAFKSMFGVWVDLERRDTGQRFKKLVEYRNMDLLQEQMLKVGSRIMKEDVLDLPPKLYSTRYFDLAPKQRKVYEELKDNMITFLENGDMVAADLAIVKIMRLQQVTSGWLPTEDDATVMTPICEQNPRLKLLAEVIEDTDHQMIVWAKYRQDITNIMELCRKLDVTAVRYDGTCNDDQMARAIDDFKSGNAQVFVANPKKASEGITLTCAKTMVYYNQNWKLAERLQSEDRIHRIGQDVPVHIIDICAADTVDRAIIEALTTKRQMAAFIQGDELKDWIQ